MSNPLRRAGSAVSNIIREGGERFMPTPPHVEGLLDREDISAARRSGALALGFGLLSHDSSPLEAFQAAQGAYGSQMGNTMQMNQVAEQRAQGQQRAQATAAMRAKYPKPPSTPDEARQMAIDFAMAGLPLEGGVSEMIKTWQNPEPAKPVTVSEGASLVSPTDGRVIYRAPKSATPRDPNAPNPQAAIEVQRQYQREQGLADDYNKDVGRLREFHQRIRGAVAEKDRAIAGDGAAGINMLYAFITAMDPTSVVREGEMALVRSAATPVQQAQTLLARYGEGKNVIVPSQLIDQMSRLMERRAQGLEGYAQERSQYYQERARRWGVDPSAFPPLTPIATPPRTSGDASRSPNGSVFRGYYKP